MPPVWTQPITWTNDDLWKLGPLGTTFHRTWNGQCLWSDRKKIMMTSSNGNIFPRYRPFVWGIHRSPVNSPHKGQWRGALMFSLICVWINGGVNNREAGDLRCYHAHYNVTVMLWCPTGTPDPDGPNRLMTELLYIYRPRQFHTTCDGTNRPSGCGVTVSTKFGWMNGSDQWKNGWKDRHGLIDSLSYFPSERRGTIARQKNYNTCTLFQCLSAWHFYWG